MNDAPDSPLQQDQAAIESGAACAGGSCRRGVNWGLIFLSLLLFGFIGFQLYARRTAPVPEVFDRSVTLGVALERAADTDRPVFALLTADWCGPCQVYKRNALAEPATVDFLLDRTVPVYIDFDKNQEDTLELARRAGLSERIALPMSVLLVDGKVVGSRTGVMSAGEVRSWVDQSIAGAAAPADSPDSIPGG